jgi:hypothetical protein
MPMARFFSELFRVAGFVPRVEDRWTVLMRPRDIANCDAPNLCQRETPNADSGLDVRHVSGQIGRLRSYWDFAYRDFASCDVKFFDSLKPRTPKNADGIICCHLSCEMDGCDRFGISRFRVSGFFFGEQSLLLVQLPIPDDVGISQGKNPTVSSRGLNLEHFLPDLTVVGPLHKIGRLKCFCPFRALLDPSGLVSRLGTVRRTNVAASMAVLRT